MIGNGFLHSHGGWLRSPLLALTAIGIVLSLTALPVAGAAPPCKGPNKNDPGCGNDNGGGGGDKFSVDVTFRDLDCDTNEVGRDHFCSDRYFIATPTPYEDGVDGVAAGGDKFRFGLTLRSGSSRRFFLDFSDRVGDGEPDNCVSGPLTCDVTPSLDMGDTGLTSGGGAENVFSTGTQEEPFSLLDMGEGETKLRNFQISFSDVEGDRWVLHFDPSQCNDTTLVPVKRTGDTWDFTATDTEFACLQRRVGGRGPTTSHGRYTVPFKLTVTLQP